MAAVNFTFHGSITVFPDRLRRIKTGAPRRAADAILPTAAKRIGTRYSGQGQYGTRLASAGKVVVGLEPTGAEIAKVVFAHPLARLHHDGARPHLIGAPGKILYNPLIPSTSRGTSFFARRAVRHPGTKPNRYLTDAARDLGLKVQSPALGAKTTITAVIRVNF